jgi:succinyl-diaminopimelate desuccinylase
VDFFKNITKKVDKLDDETVNICSRLIQFPTQSPPGYTDEIVDFIQSYFKKIGVETEIHTIEKKKPNIVAHIKGASDRTIIWLGHIDVVPIGNPENWAYPPFSGEVKDGKIWGRGSSDMKGSNASAMIAARVLNTVKPPHNIDFWFTADEEIGSRAGVKWLAENQIIKGEVAIVGDGGGCTPGMINIGVGNKGGIGTKIIARGKTAHGSKPFLGENALDRLLKTISMVRRIREYRLELPQDLAPIIKSSVELLLREKGLTVEQKLTIKSLYDYPTGPSLNILNGGVKSNVVPDYAEAYFDIRLTPGSDPMKVRARIMELIQEAGVPGVTSEIRESKTAGYYEPPNAPSVKCLAETVEKVTGEKPALTIAPWGTDAVRLKHFIKTDKHPNGIPALIFGPMIENQLHQSNEYVPIQNLITAAKVYALFPFYYR